jgi:CBS domain-containing protein
MTMSVGSLITERGFGGLVSIEAGASVAEAVDLMVERDVGAVLVMGEDELFAGIFTERDLLVRVARPRRDPATTPLSLVMTRDVRFVTPDTPVEAALSLMHVNHYRHLLVIDGPRVHGLVSMRDLAYELIRRGEGRFEAAIRNAGQNTEN